MSGRFRHLVEQIDVEKVVHGCHMHTRLSPDVLRDQLFEVLTVMLEKQEQYDMAFENVHALEGYIRRSIIRSAIRQQKRTDAHHSLQSYILQDRSASPEEHVQYILDQSRLSNALESILSQHQESEHIEDYRNLLHLILSDPDLYIRKRRSGEQEGTLVFQHVLLAKTLGWTRKVLSNRIHHLRKMFFQLA